jgi:hypothetical protein
LNPLTIAGLNPQPLPPRIAFTTSLTQHVIARAELMQEVATIMADQGQKQGIIVVGGFISRFVDDWCGTGWRPRWPFPGPRPPWWPKEVSGLDLLIMGTQFVQSSSEVTDKSFQEQLQTAGAQLNETGMRRL